MAKEPLQPTGSCGKMLSFVFINISLGSMGCNYSTHDDVEEGKKKFRESGATKAKQK